LIQKPVLLYTLKKQKIPHSNRQLAQNLTIANCELSMAAKSAPVSSSWLWLKAAIALFHTTKARIFAFTALASELKASAALL